MKTIQYLNPLLAIILLHTPFSNAMVLEFGEADFSLREDRGPLRVLVVAQGGLSGSITVEVTPMTVSRFTMEGLSPLPDELGSLDHAEQGDDFDDSSITLTLQGDGNSPSVENTALINIVNDHVSEFEEVFLLVLRVVNATEGIQIDTGRNVSVARIRLDNDAFMTSISFSMGSLMVNEGDGLLNDTLFIEVDGEVEPTLYFRISTNEGTDDIRPLLSNISIPSGVRRVAVPLEIIDDEIVEDAHEDVRIHMSSSPDQQSLFGAGEFISVRVTIIDNDRPHFGFEVDLPSTASAGNSNTTRQLLEGRSAEICMLLLEPNEFETDVQIVVNLSLVSSSKPLLKVDGLEKSGYLFSRVHMRYCFNVTAVEDDIISESSTVRFSMMPQSVFYFSNEVERVDTDVLHVLIRDNDGIPNAPSDIKLELTNSGKDLLIRWRAEPTPLQPISQFRVIVKSTDASRSRRSVIGRSPRQSDDVETEPTEHLTTDTRFTLENIESDRMYTVQICAENDLGHACAPPEKFTIKSNGKLRILQPAYSDGLGPSSNAESASLPLGYIIAIIVVPSLLLLAVCFLVILVVVCSCYRRSSKNYYPSQQEKKMEQQSGDLDGEYVMKSSSMYSISSTTSSVSEFTPV